MRSHTYKQELWVPYSAGHVFPFFADANNLDSITPDWLKFRVLTPNANIQKGAILEYRLKWHGIPLRWITEIIAWEPPYRFIDTQIKGPYKKWVHEHRFEEVDHGTLIIDEVDFEIYGWLLEPIIYRYFVHPDVERIFNFRKDKLEKLYPGKSKVEL